MRKLLLILMTTLVASIALAGSVALAQAQAHPASHPAGAHSVTHNGRRCDTLIGGAPNASRTRFHVSPITNTCNDQYRALDLCMGRTGSGTREYGPWVSGYNESNTSPCPVNAVVVEGATQFPYHDRHTYCLWGCSSTLLAYQYVRPQLVAPGTRHTACTQHYTGSVNPSANSWEVHWLTIGCGYFLNSEGACVSRFMGGYNQYTTWRTSTTHSSGSCKSGYVIQEVWARKKASAHGSVSKCEEWPDNHCSGRLVAIRRH